MNMGEQTGEQKLSEVRQQQIVRRSRSLRAFAGVLTPEAFAKRKKYLVEPVRTLVGLCNRKWVHDATLYAITASQLSLCLRQAYLMYCQGCQDRVFAVRTLCMKHASGDCLQLRLFFAQA